MSTVRSIGTLLPCSYVQRVWMQQYEPWEARSILVLLRQEPNNEADHAISSARKPAAAARLMLACR